MYVKIMEKEREGKAAKDSSTNGVKVKVEAAS